MSKIQLVNDELMIRPSSVDGFFGCAQQWARQHIGGERSISSGRAAIGTAVHKGVEVMWNEAIQSGKKDANISMMTDAAIACLQEQEKGEGVAYDEGENQNTASVEIVKGTQTFIEDIEPYTSIPTGVEQFFKVDLEHPIVTGIGGTVDYITNDTIADVKTSKRKTGAESHSTQQSIYKMLANANGCDIRHNLIQLVVLKKVPDGHILTLDADIDSAKNKVNIILDTLDVYHQDIVDPDILFRGNPKYMFCSEKFCAFHKTCKFVKGNAPEPKSQPKL